MHSSGPGPISPTLPFLTPLAPVQRPAASASSAALTGPTAAPPSAALQAPQPTAPGANAPVAGAPPTGVNPALWGVLTADEQQFFQQMAALGQLTYGARPSQTAPDAPVGQRLDIRG